MSAPSLITLQHVSKSYHQVPVWEDLNLSFKEKGIYVIMGPSGSGKTTLLRLLMGLELPDSGRIIKQEGMKQAAVFQEPRLCENLSVSLNIRLPAGRLSFREKKIQKKKIKENLTLIGMPGLSGKPVCQLSGGMKQRVAILRAVMAESQLVFFDEPLKGLDPENKLRVMKVIGPYLENKTIFWVTHEETDLKFFSHPTLIQL